MPGISLRPSTFVEGGAVPVDRNLRWTKCRFTMFDYPNREGVPQATPSPSGEITYVDDDGQEYVQNYSVGAAERYGVSSDGKTLEAIGAAQNLTKSSNFGILLDHLVKAGFPENRITDDITDLEGLKTFNIGLPEPTRTGLARQESEASAGRARVISVPSKVLEMPGQTKGKKGAKAGTSVSESTDDEVAAKAVAIAKDNLDGDGAVVARKELAKVVVKDLASDPDRAKVARYIFSADFEVALLAEGLELTPD